MKTVKLFVLFLLMLATTSSLAFAAFPCEVIDCHGRKVLLAQEPKRIVIAGRAGFMITNAAFFFRTAPDKLVSYSRSLQLVNNDRFYQMVDPGFASRIFNDFETSIEELAAMKPDIILLRGFERQKYERSFDSLGIKVAFFSLENPASHTSEIETLGKIFGEAGRGIEIAEFYRSWQKKIAARLLKYKVSNPQVLHIYPSSESGAVSHHLTTPPAARTPRVLHLYYSEKGGAVSFNVSPASWIQAWLVEQAGGEAIWKDAGVGSGWQQIGFDQIAAWQPEFVLVTSYGSDVEKARDKLLKDPLWAEMAAVKKQKMYAFPEDYVSWDQPDSRWILGLCWLAATLRPEIPELRTDMHELYQSFFALYGLTPEQIGAIEIRGDYF
ncbi:MAG TPA: hypothetical protein DCG57_09520 [Candidatus Riflebacteria bacterium]|nr:hypothetical protein [Candidatus Riflebacteria bacterium]